MKNKYELHIRTIALQHDVKVVQVNRRYLDVRGSCAFMDHDTGARYIVVPNIRTLQDYTAALHEIGHHATGWNSERSTRERRAWAWARYNAIYPLDKRLERNARASHRRFDK